MRPEFDIENYGRRNKNIYFSGADRKKKPRKVSRLWNVRENIARL